MELEIFESRFAFATVPTERCWLNADTTLATSLGVVAIAVGTTKGGDEKGDKLDLAPALARCRIGDCSSSSSKHRCWAASSAVDSKCLDWSNSDWVSAVEDTLWLAVVTRRSEALSTGNEVDAPWNAVVPRGESGERVPCQNNEVSLQKSRSR